jgi:ubiquinol-cytochrome c reductase core subunit 2
MIYAVQCLRNQFSTGFEYLSDVALGPVFKTWELDDAKARLQTDLDIYNQSLAAKLMDAVHRAAYRDTLGNPLYMSPNSIGSFKPQSLESFVNSRYVSSNAAVAGVGVDHDTLVTAVKKLAFRQGTADDGKAAKYYGGGELRVESPGQFVQAAVVTEGVRSGTPDVLAAYVLQQAIGGAPWVQYGLNASSRLNKAAVSVTNEPFAANCINLSYSDSGLFGLQVVATYYDIGKVLRAAVGAMKQSAKNGFTDGDVQRAKSQVKSLLVLEPETNMMSSLESIGVQAVKSGQALSGPQLAALVDKVTADQVNQLAKKVLNGKPTMAAVGNVCNTPYLDELLSTV